jgi:hypothetical protein
VPHFLNCVAYGGFDRLSDLFGSRQRSLSRQLTFHFQSERTTHPSAAHRDILHIGHVRSGVSGSLQVFRINSIHQVVEDLSGHLPAHVRPAAAAQNSNRPGTALDRWRTPFYGV